MDALASASAVHPEDPHAASMLQILALDSLMPSLRLAHHYILTVAAQRYPAWLLGAHRFRDEVYLLFATLLEAHSLLRHDASFGEHFYGTHRAPTGSRVPSFGLQLFLLLAPSYLRAKIEAHLLNDEPEEAEAVAENDDIDDTPQAVNADRLRLENASATNSSSSSSAWHWSEAQQRIKTLLRHICRVGCALIDASNLWQLMLFLHGRSRHATLAQRLFGFTLRRRIAGALLVAASQGPRGSSANNGSSSSSSSSVEPMSDVVVGGGAGALPDTPRMRLLRRLAALAEAPLNHARQLLLLSVFSYRLLEWWHAPQHAPPPPPRLIPPPPPPPPRMQAAGARGFLAPPAPGLCGVCRMVPREPTVAPSGYVFCASCALGAARREAKCPVSGQMMKVEDLRRLYETSRPAAS